MLLFIADVQCKFVESWSKREPGLLRTLILILQLPPCEIVSCMLCECLPSYTMDVNTSLIIPTGRVYWSVTIKLNSKWILMFCNYIGQHS